MQSSADPKGSAIGVEGSVDRGGGASTTSSNTSIHAVRPLTPIDQSSGVQNHHRHACHPSRRVGAVHPPLSRTKRRGRYCSPPSIPLGPSLYSLFGLSQHRLCCFKVPLGDTRRGDETP